MKYKIGLILIGLIFLAVSFVGAKALHSSFFESSAGSLPSCTKTTIDKYYPCGPR